MTTPVRMAMRRILAAGEFWAEFPPDVPGRHRFMRVEDVEDDGQALRATFDGPAIFNALPNNSDPAGEFVRIETGEPITIDEERIFEHEDDETPFATRPKLAPITIPPGHVMPYHINVTLQYRKETRCLDADRVIWWLEGAAESDPYAQREEPIADTLRRIAEGLKRGEFDVPAGSLTFR